MGKLHELLAAEKTPQAAWNVMQEDTIKKFKNPEHFFHGHSKSLMMIGDTPEKQAIEDAAREEKAVPTNVYETLQYALEIFAQSEDLQAQKNKTNQRAVGTVMWRGKPLLKDLPVDELLGLEARLGRMREIFTSIPTLDATKVWEPAPNEGPFIYALKFPEEATKTEKRIEPVTLSPATPVHPAQVQAVSRDVVVGKITLRKRTGAATAAQKAEAIRRIDELLVEIKQARMRANETEAENIRIAQPIIDLLLEPLKNGTS